VAPAHQIQLVDLTVLLRGIADDVARRDAEAAQQQGRGRGVILAMTGAGFEQEISEALSSRAIAKIETVAKALAEEPSHRGDRIGRASGGGLHPAPHFAEELVVTNLGAVRHEWQALRPHAGNYHLQNLGLTSSMALGLALALPHRKVVAFDGDGSLLLNLGSLATIANQHPKNLIHIVFDNECYESSRGAPTATAGQADLAAIARGAGFANVMTANTVAEFAEGFLRALKSGDLWFILAKVEAGAGDVPAAALDSVENKYLFVRYIEKSENLKILTSTLSRASDKSAKAKT